MTSDIPEGTICSECRVHLAAVRWAKDEMSWIHGFSSMLCSCCRLKRDVREAERWAALLPVLREELLGVRCETAPSPLSIVHLVPEMNRARDGRPGITACCGRLTDKLNKLDTVTEIEAEATCW